MTLEQAIDRYTNNAEYERTHGSLHGCLEFRQLAEWLKNYKRLKEQESVLDKIRAEILLRDKTVKDVRTDGHCFFTAEEIFGIIDKYKAESEDKE